MQGFFRRNNRLMSWVLGYVLFSFMTQLSFAAEQTRESSSTRVQHGSRQSSSPKIAVTDLSFEQKVANHFLKYDSHSSSASSHSTTGGAGGYSGGAQSNSEQAEHLETGTEIVIDRGEMRKFTADIKGEMIKSGYRIVQGKPWISKDTENIYDIIERIKAGYYPNAEYVLFGSVNSVDMRNESNPIQGSNAVNHSLSLEMVVEFSLINAKTYEVVAAFSVMGEGSDSRLVGAASSTSVTLSRSKAMSQLSRSLGEGVVNEITAQFAPQTQSAVTHLEEKTQEKVIRFQ